MNRQAQAVVLLLVGGAILRASLTDLYLRYVKEGLRPFLIVAGVLLVAAAVATLWYELRPGRPAAGHEHDDDHDDGHGHAEPRVAWLLILPVLALLLVAPPALGSYAANRSGTALQETSDFPPLPAGDPVTVGLVDYATRAVYDDVTANWLAAANYLLLVPAALCTLLGYVLRTARWRVNLAEAAA